MSYICSAVDSNAVIDGSSDALDELAKAIRGGDESIIDGITQDLRPKFLRFRIPGRLAQKVPLPFNEVYDMIEAKVSDGNILLDRLDLILTNDEIVKAFYWSKQTFKQSGFNVENLLFHGTESCNIASIFSKKFDPEATPKNHQKATVHGAGVYFAKRFSTALGYSTTGSAIVSRVLLGDRLVSKEDERRGKDFIDSKCVAGQDIIVVKRPNQILPFGVVYCHKRSTNFGAKHLWRPLGLNRYT